MKEMNTAAVAIPPLIATLSRLFKTPTIINPSSGSRGINQAN